MNDGDFSGRAVLATAGAQGMGRGIDRLVTHAGVGASPARAWSLTAACTGACAIRSDDPHSRR